MVLSMKHPNFFIVGAPKCATTALYRYLKTHPNIFMPEHKEPCFFCTDFPDRRVVDSLDEYLQLFADANENHLAIGEASVWYLYSKVAIKNLYEFNPVSRLIVMLRNPIEQAYAMHMQCSIEGFDVETDFVKAWRLQDIRKSGQGLPSPSKEAHPFLQYKEIASYDAQIKRLLSIFPQDQVKFILFDDLKSDPRRVYLEVLNFLELEDDKRHDFSVEHPSQQFKVPWLGRFLLNQPKWLESLKLWIKRIFRVDRLLVGSFIAKHNVKVGNRNPLPPGFIAELKDEFREEVARVSVLIERDLSHWCE